MPCSFISLTITLVGKAQVICKQCTSAFHYFICSVFLLCVASLMKRTCYPFTYATEFLTILSLFCFFCESFYAAWLCQALFFCFSLRKGRKKKERWVRNTKRINVEVNMWFRTLVSLFRNREKKINFSFHSFTQCTQVWWLLFWFLKFQRAGESGERRAIVSQRDFVFQNTSFWSSLVSFDRFLVVLLNFSWFWFLTWQTWTW